MYAYISFFIWPFFSLIYALGNIKSNFTKNIVWFFCAFFGYTFIISNPEMDANRYQEKLILLYGLRDVPFYDLLIEPYHNKGIYSGTDIYSHLITLIISRFTNDFRILFAIVGFIYGYFFSRNIFYIFDFIRNHKLQLLAVSSLLLLAFILPFWNINGYRFYTAAHVFLFGILRIVVEKRYRYIWLCLIVPLIHFSFLFPVAVLLFYLIFRNRFSSLCSCFACFLVFTELDPKTINERAELAPVFMQNKVMGYTRGEYVKFAQSIYTGMNWYVLGHVYALNFCIYLRRFVFILKKEKIFK
ncbi:MAG: EpsG family protein [Saprospiraceae bacterium]|nr:EpsG family protein [Saprospiraceae bacterium]